MLKAFIDSSDVYCRIHKCFEDFWCFGVSAFGYFFRSKTTKPLLNFIHLKILIFAKISITEGNFSGTPSSTERGLLFYGSGGNHKCDLRPLSLLDRVQKGLKHCP